MIQKQNSKRIWRSLDEFHDTPEFQQAIDHDFGAAAPAEQDGLSRRRWLQLMGASMAFGSVAGCRYPHENIAPFAFRPQGRLPGVPDSYATMLEFGGVAKPILAKSVDGRPIKLDGNPDHPDSGTATDAFTQATILELYDPDRSRSSAKKSGDRLVDCSWDQVFAALSDSITGAGEGVAVLCEPNSSPTLERLKGEFLSRYSQAKWYEFTSISNDNQLAGNRLVFGSPMRTSFALEGAQVIVTLDADPLGIDVAATKLSRDFARGRDADHHRMNRLYAVESNFSTTGAMADHRLPMQFRQMDSFLADLEAAVDRRLAGAASPPGSSHAEKVLEAMAQDLVRHRGESAVMVGWAHDAQVHARAARINSKLGNVGKTVLLFDVGSEHTPGVEQLKELSAAIGAGSVSTLLILGGNPSFFAPADLKFEEALASVKNSFHLSLYRDETSRVCQWHFHAAHPLESWGDGRSLDGSTLLAQPLIEPLFGGRSAIELVSAVVGHDPSGTNGQEHIDEHGDEHASVVVENTGLLAVKATSGGRLSGSHPQAAWEQSIHDGFLPDTAASPQTPSLLSVDLPAGDGAWKQEWNKEAELVFIPSSSTYDGRFANSGWLQELPNFVHKLTWDNAALVSPQTARQLNLRQGRLANFMVGESQSITLPVFIVPGLALGTVCAALGYGRQAAGRVAGDADIQVASVGSDVRPLRTSGNWWSVPSVTTVSTKTSYDLAGTQEHFMMDQVGRDEINRRMGPGSDLLREGTFDNYMQWLQDHPQTHDESHDSSDDAGEEQHHASWPAGHHLHFENFELTKASYKDDEVPHKWAMAIDLNKCTGCNACVIACQAENNIPVVGKEQVKRGREMQWMRIDRYFITEPDDTDGVNPQVACQPVTCQHCENAPCETVCPVAATTHSAEGLNDMVYNRCIGTRYCGNNCPYKVRRFNYYNFTDAQTFLKIPGADRLSQPDLALQNMMMNPEVTVRSRGVMEKCTYCIQRIQNTKIKAKTEDNRPIGPNEIRTACQDVCPTEAIVFGDILNTESELHKLHNNPRSYFLLDALNVLPRTKYLARVRNPHPSLVTVSSESDQHA